MRDQPGACGSNGEASMIARGQVSRVKPQGAARFEIRHGHGQRHRFEGRIDQRPASLDELTPGDVLIKPAYSSVNYKDALAATGAGKILRRFPIIAGIDVSGTVESSSDTRFAAGVPFL
jgi:hypothetical protein